MGDPCAGVTCARKPVSHCEDESTLAYWDGKPGVCTDGVCGYGIVKEECPEGCVDGRCEGDPCKGVYCDTPPAFICTADGSLSPGSTVTVADVLYDTVETGRRTFKVF